MIRILALDFGTKRVGAAIGDSETAIASPLEVYHRRTSALDAAHYRAVVTEHRVHRLVVGLPLSTGGGEGGSARRARDWGTWLSAELGLPVVFYDERFTTTEADELLRSHGLKASERRTRVDMMAAHILLQDYLDAGSPAEERASTGLADYPPGPGS